MNTQDALLIQLLEEASRLLREPLDFSNRNTWADVRNARSKIAQAYKIAVAADFLRKALPPLTDYAERVRQLEDEGLTTSDAQAAADVEVQRGLVEDDKFISKTQDVRYQCPGCDREHELWVAEEAGFTCPCGYRP